MKLNCIVIEQYNTLYIGLCLYKKLRIFPNISQVVSHLLGDDLFLLYLRKGLHHKLCKKMKNVRFAESEESIDLGLPIIASFFSESIAGLDVLCPVTLLVLSTSREKIWFIRFAVNLLLFGDPLVAVSNCSIVMYSKSFYHNNFNKFKCNREFKKNQLI